MHELGQAGLLLRPRLKGVHAVGAFDDEHVRAAGRNVGLDQAVVLFARIVACVKDFEAEDVDVIR
jgi:hypothetical protein